MAPEPLNLQDLQAQLKASIRNHGGGFEHWRDLGLTLQMQGAMAGAERALLQALAENPSHALSHYTLSRQLDYSHHPQLLCTLEALQPEHYSTPEEQILLCFAKASVFARLGRHGDAAAWLSAGNRLQRQQTPSDLRDIEQIVQWRQTLGDPHTTMPSVDAQAGAGLLFVVGLPRCGSTLLSSILSTNGQIEDLGECEWLEACVSEHLQAPAQHPLAGIGDRYLQRVRERSQHPWRIDKSLYNFANLNLIAQQLPAARVIHCRRHPLAQALSIHQTRFSEGSRFSTSVEEIARMLVLERSVLKQFAETHSHQLFTLQYEALCTNPEAELKRLLRWLGLPWLPCYLQHHQNRNTVETASLAQVRQPIHRQSVERWRLYRTLLAPMVRPLLQALPNLELF